MINITIERKHVYLLAIIVTLAALLVPAGAWASHRFNDVPTSNTFHDDITWLADAGVTLGCGGGNYCPDAPVTRGQMAAFMHRFSTNQSPRAEHVGSTNLPDVGDYTLATPNRLATPAAGTILVTGSVNAFLGSSYAYVTCELRVNGQIIETATRTTQATVGSVFRICATSGAINVAAGSHTIEMKITSGGIGNALDAGSLSAVWIPLDGSGNTPYVP